MSLKEALAALPVSSLGGTRQKRQVIMTADGTKFTLPVTPWKYDVQTAQLNKTVDIIDFGEALLFGNAKLLRLKFSCFFPRNYHGYKSFISGDNKDALECVELMIKWKEAKKPIRVIITDTPINHMMAIQDFDYNERDGSHDIYYTLSLIEYKDLNTPPANNDKQVDEATGLKERPIENTPPVSTDKIQKVRDIAEVALKAYGDIEKWRNIADNNDIVDLAKIPIMSLDIGE